MADGLAAVFATEFEDNAGTSIANAAEHPVRQISLEFSIDLSCMVWVGITICPTDPQRPRTYNLASKSAGEQPPLA